MNMNQIFNMVTRMLTRRAVNWGLNKVTRTGASKAPTSPEAKRLNQQNRETVKRARQAARLTRRMGR